MEFCIISPTTELERYARLSKTHLVLAHIGEPDYIKFYQKRRAEFDWIILDNGAYESAGMPGAYLNEVIQVYDPNVVVLPDFPLESWQKTWHAGIHFLDAYADRYPGINWCYIPQAEKGDLHGFMESYGEAISDPRITWLGIPRALAYAITDNPLARVDFARLVRRDRPNLKLHAFGMVNGDVHELGYLSQAGVTSIDSSAPVWRGWQGYRISHPEDRKLWDINGTQVDFAAEWKAGERPDYRQSNLHEVLEACGVRT